MHFLLKSNFYVLVFLACHMRILEWKYTPCSKQVRYLKFKWLLGILSHNDFLNKRSTIYSEQSKWMSVDMRTKWLRVRIPLQSNFYVFWKYSKCFLNIKLCLCIMTTGLMADQNPRDPPKDSSELSHIVYRWKIDTD